MLKVAKFGGSSMADANQFNKIKAIVEADPERRVVVVSAPGKRFSSDHKVTDLLYLCHAHSKYGVSSYSTFAKIAKRYRTIAQSLDLSIARQLDAEFIELQKQIDDGMTEDEVASRGEFYAARLMADFLGFKFIDSKDWLTFAMDGTIDQATSYKKLRKLVGRDKVVLPGFYGAMPDGEIKLLSRGGSDITGALAAAALGADVYENWTDVDGVLMADPTLVDNPPAIQQLNYDELRELAYAGAQVLHEETIFPVLETKIPVNIRNVNNVECPGTLILSETQAETNAKAGSKGKDKAGSKGKDKAGSNGKGRATSQNLITGIAGGKGYSLISVSKYGSSGSLKVQREVMQIMEKYGIGDVLSLTGVDSMDYIIPGELARKFKYVIMSDIESAIKPDKLEVTNDLAILNIVGRNMAGRVGADSYVFDALDSHNVSVKFSCKRAGGISIIVGIDNSQYEDAVIALYRAAQ